jgi:DNA-binding MarR family transcriptional regulator
MADYLCVDRSALSAVLSRLQQEGLIRFKRNRFTIL